MLLLVHYHCLVCCCLVSCDVSNIIGPSTILSKLYVTISYQQKINRHGFKEIFLYSMLFHRFTTHKCWMPKETQRQTNGAQMLKEKEKKIQDKFHRRIKFKRFSVCHLHCVCSFSKRREAWKQPESHVCQKILVRTANELGRWPHLM